MILALLLPLPYLILGLSTYLWQSAPTVHTAASAILLLLTGGVILALFLPIGNRLVPKNDTPLSRIDERDIMFSRTTSSIPIKGGLTTTSARDRD
jgi:hypothetical protein